jgi:TonB family protein
MLVCALAASAPSLRAQTHGATLTKKQDPVYPEDASQKDKQGNALFIGKIDKNGNVKDLHMASATSKEFVAPAMDAVRAWKFKPAIRDGQPIEVPLNAAVRFRKTGPQRGLIPVPILGDIAVYPADASGAKTAPDGFPIRKGKDPALRAEVVLDVSPQQPRTVAVKVEAISPSGKVTPIFQPPLAVPGLATEVTFPVILQVRPDWEEGVWILRFTTDDKNAGGGQFWVATDPDKFTFVLPVAPR